MHDSVFTKLEEMPLIEPWSGTHWPCLPPVHPKASLHLTRGQCFPIPGSHCSPLRVRKRRISIATSACALPRREVLYQTAPARALGPPRARGAKAAQRGGGNTWREPVLTSSSGTPYRNGEADSLGIKMLVLKLTSTPYGERHKQPYTGGRGSNTR